MISENIGAILSKISFDSEGNEPKTPVMKLWQRYLFEHLIRSFFFFLICILVLYIAIDFSMHGAKFLSKETTSCLDIGVNYLRHFAKFISLFFSLSFLFSMLKVLLDLNAHREIVALQTAGLSSKK